MNEEPKKQPWISVIVLGFFYVLFHFGFYVDLVGGYITFDPIKEFGAIIGSLVWPATISSIIASKAFKINKLKGIFKANIFKFDFKSPLWWRNMILLGFLFNLLNIFITE